MIRLALLLILVVAVALRLIGIQYGLPHVYNPDEVAIMARALSFAKGTLNPHNFLYPTLYFYVLFAWVGVYLAFVWITGRVGSLAELQQLYFTAPTGIYTAGRLLGVVSGAATCLAIFALARRLFSTRVAVAAALFLAVAPLHVRDSHYVKHDVPATLAIVVAYLAIARVWPLANAGEPRRNVLMAGAACGVAFATHYYCVFVALPLAFAVFQAYRSQGLPMVLRRVIEGGIAMGVVFLVCSPFVALEPATAWRDITANRQIVIDRAVSGGAFSPALRYLDILWSDSVGIPVLLLAAAGAIYLLMTRAAVALLLLSFPVTFFLFIANTFPASRYLNPILPFVVLFAALALSALWERWRWPAAAFWVAALLCAIPGAAASVRTGLFFREADTRTIALSQIESMLPAGSGIVVQPYSVPLNPTRDSLERALTRNVGSVAAASTKFQIQLAQHPWPSPSFDLVYLGRGLDAEKTYVDYSQLGNEHGLKALRELGVAYVVLKGYNRSDPQTLPFIDAVTREGRLVATFSPYRPGTSAADAARIEPFLHNTDARIDPALERPGPVLEIWQIDGPGF